MGCLFVELLLVLDDLEGDGVTGLVIQRLDHLAEAALAEIADDLVAEGDVVAGNGLVVAVLVVVRGKREELAALVEAGEVHAANIEVSVFILALKFVDFERRQFIFEVSDGVVGCKSRSPCLHHRHGQVGSIRVRQ